MDIQEQIDEAIEGLRSVESSEGTRAKTIGHIIELMGTFRNEYPEDALEFLQHTRSYLVGAE